MIAHTVFLLALSAFCWKLSFLRPHAWAMWSGLSGFWFFLAIRTAQ